MSNWNPPALASDEQTSLRELAFTVRNNKHFRAIIMDAKPYLRRAVYDQLVPLLTFKAKPYWLLIK